MKVIVNFGEKKVVVPCGTDGDLSIRELIDLAAAKYCKLSSYNNGPNLNSAQVQLRLNNGAVVDPDDRVCDVVDDREELFAIVNSHTQHLTESIHPPNSNGELSSSVTSSNLSSSLSEHEQHRPMIPLPTSNSSSITRHEVIVTDADLRTRSLRVKSESKNHHQQMSQVPSSSSYGGKINHLTGGGDRPTYSPPTQDANRPSSSDDIGMYNIHVDEKTGEKTFRILLPKENSPLGIHVIPYNGDEQQVNGLLLQNIEADGRIKRQGILHVNDRIIEINRTNIERCSFDKAQLIFRTALLEPELELKIIRNLRKPFAPTIPPKPASFRLNNNNNKPRSTLSEISQNNDLSFTDNDSNMNSLNTRRLGKIIKIILVKGNDGLGFKLAARDNPTGVANPIYVKSIFPKGAAIEDGRLQRGDRLLSVNTIDVTQMSLQDTVGLLRETRVGDTVELCISRQRDGSLPQDLINDGTQVTDSGEVKPQTMTFDIPLNDTSSAGLGITLKGKTSLVDGKSIDLGIFVKTILNGGAASRDNRLRPNDQLLVINEASLINTSNLEAAAILHEAVRHEIHPGHIKVTISRVPMTPAELRESEQEQHLNSTHESSRYVKETDLLPPPSLTIDLKPAVNNDENELDLTNFVAAPPPPPLSRKPPSQHRHSARSESTRVVDFDVRPPSPRVHRQSPSRNKPTFVQQTTPDETDLVGTNPFERETPFRQSISEKRRLTHQPNKQAVQWKQRSFHEGRSQSERKQPMRALPNHPSSNSNNNNGSSPTLVRASSLESLQPGNSEVQEDESPNLTTSNDEERKRQAKLRSRACNDSFRQAVDKSYCQNHSVNEDESSTPDKKQRFRFANLFTTKSKRKDNLDDSRSSNQSLKAVVAYPQSSPAHNNNQPSFYPPPPAAFSSRQDSTSSTSSTNRKTRSNKNDRPSTSFNYPSSSAATAGHLNTNVVSSSSTNTQQQGYQPYRFESNQVSRIQLIDHFTPTTRYDSQIVHDHHPSKSNNNSIPGKASLTITSQKSSHPPIPRQFLQANINGTQSFKHNVPSSHPSVLPSSSSRSPYPSTFTVQPSHFTSYSHNMDFTGNMPQQQQTTRRIGYTVAPVYPTSRGYLQLESPANV